MIEFFSKFNSVFILMSIVTIGIGVGFGKFARTRLNQSLGSLFTGHENPPTYFRFLMFEEILYQRLFWMISIIVAFVFKWWYLIGFIVIYILGSLFCGVFEGIYQRFSRERLNEKWTFLKFVALPFDYMVIRLVLQELPKQLEIFGYNVSTLTILFVPTLLISSPIIIYEVLGSGSSGR